MLLGKCQIEAQNLSHIYFSMVALDRLNTDACVCDLADKLKVMREFATDIGLGERDKRSKTMIERM